MLAIFFVLSSNAQPCTPAGDETTFGTNDVWIGYIYDNMNFTAYHGYVNEGITGNPNFDENFGGDQANYSVNGCPVYTESFSARYLLTKTFAAGNYQFIVGADDGYRLSIDGGSTWIIDRFYDQAYNFSSYTAALNGTYNLVIEFYENGGGNRLSFSVSAACVAGGSQTVSGTGDVWMGYIYQGTNFNTYNGTVTEGSTGNPNFDQNYGGNNTLYATSSCMVTTEGFSARYRLQKTFASNNYMFTIGGDDGYRLSLDGGNTWVIDRWADQGYNTTTYSTWLTGTYDMVLEYYENGGDNRLSFNVALNSLLPVELSYFDGRATNTAIQLNWKSASEINSDYYQVERSFNGTDFNNIGKINAATAIAEGTGNTYGFADASPLAGNNYYRLRMIDKDGKSALSAVIKILFNQHQGVRIYPAIVNNREVYLQTTGEIKSGTVTIFEMTGRQLQSVQLPSVLSAGQTVRLHLSALPPGNYALICSTGAGIKSKQLIIVQ